MFGKIKSNSNESKFIPLKKYSTSARINTHIYIKLPQTLLPAFEYIIMNENP